MNSLYKYKNFVTDEIEFCKNDHQIPSRIGLLAQFEVVVMFVFDDKIRYCKQIVSTVMIRDH